MKGIKLILLSVVITAMLTSCGTNNAKNTKTSPAPRATSSSNVSDTNNGTIEDDSKNTGNSMRDDAGNAVKDAGDMAKDAGDAVGDIARDTGDVAGDIVDGAGNVVEDAGDAVGDAVEGSNKGN
ncbi:MAG: hypothetical protein J1F01_05350 [Oscillospiraceae bacterium]|nr:hypothetical protein [Oscillospiraceae bacterium]